MRNNLDLDQWFLRRSHFKVLFYLYILFSVIFQALVTILFSVSSKLKQNTYKLHAYYIVMMWCH